MLKDFLSLLLTGAAVALFSLSVEARTNIDLGFSINTAPPAPPQGVVVMPPQGYNNCYMTQGMWAPGNVWIPPHQECNYPGEAGPAVWSAGYWGCYSFRHDGYCKHWRWYTHRWARGHYYGRHHDEYHHDGYHHHDHWH